MEGSSASALCSCVDLYAMTTLPPMRLLFRQAAILCFAVSLGFFCSCERHRATELPAEQERGLQPGTHEEKTAPAGQHHPEDGASNTAASPVGTPAQFFPQTSPSPR